MTYQIHLSGIVQGVGFRPMVYALAVDYGLCGTVTNSSQGVVIRFNATEEQAEKFYQEVLASAPPHSVVVAHSLTPIENIRFTTFTIEDSVDEDLTRVLLSPDFAMCETCRAEKRTATNRRFLYPFITCAQCGPRYSIFRDYLTTAPTPACTHLLCAKRVQKNILMLPTEDFMRKQIVALCVVYVCVCMQEEICL